MQQAIRKITFPAKDRAFHDELHRRVDAYFAARGLSKKADRRMWIKVALVLGAFVGLYLTILLAGLPMLANLVLAVVLGAVIAQIGFNVGHDAIHGSVSERPWVNNLLAMGFDVVGASSYNWSHAHNFVHHTYTNVPGVDHDLDPGPWLVFKPTAKPHALHRFQHMYAWALYGLTTVVWLLKKDFVQMLEPDPRTGERTSTKNILKVLRAKALYIVFFVVVPLAVMDITWWQLLLGSLAMHWATGTSLAVVFQLAHCVEETDFPQPEGEKLARGFSAHQLMTTCNFAGQSPVATFFTGGLNHQVEHHLFPKISHVHYPAIAPIVKQTAAEFGLPYLENPTFFAALRSHTRALKRFGRPAAATITPLVPMHPAARAA